MDRHLLCYKRMWVTGASGYGEVAPIYLDAKVCSGIELPTPN